MLDHQEQEAPVCWQIRQKHWNCIYRSSVSIRDTRESSTALDSRSFTRSWLARGNSFGWEEDRARNWMEKERERRRDGFVAFLPFYRPFWAPLPKRGEGSDNEEDPFDDFGFESFLDRFLEAMFRMSWLPIG